MNSESETVPPGFKICAIAWTTIATCAERVNRSLRLEGQTWWPPQRERAACRWHRGTFCPSFACSHALRGTAKVCRHRLTNYFDTHSPKRDVVTSARMHLLARQVASVSPNVDEHLIIDVVLALSTDGAASI